MMQLRWIVTGIFCVMAFSVAAQQPKKEVREGNKLYKEENYKGAAESYKKALQKKPNYTPGLFNLGNAQYQQKEFEQSRKIYEGAAKTVKEKEVQSAANYNIGNTYLEEKKYKEAIEAYKEALRKNPQDEQAKYNMSYALEMLKNQQGGGGNDKNKDKDKKDKNDQQKDDKNEQNNKDEKKENKGNDEEDKNKKNNQDQQQQNEQEKKDEKEKRPQPKPSKLSEQQAEQLLNALQQEEKKLQDKMKQGKGVPMKVEKDW